MSYLNSFTFLFKIHSYTIKFELHSNRQFLTSLQEYSQAPHKVSVNKGPHV